MTNEQTNSSNEEFQDPLEDFTSPQYNDAVEKALIEEPVSAIQGEPFSTITPETTIAEAINKLTLNHIACLMVEKEGKLVGVFSDRDALKKVALDFDKIKDHPISDVMTSDPIFVHDTDSSAAALTVMAVNGYRHVPVIDADQNIVGIVSPQRVTLFLQDHF